MNMDNQRSPLLGVSFAYYCQGKSVEEELRSSLWYTKLELEQTKLAVQDELRKKDDQLAHLKDVLAKAARDRDEAQDKYQALLLEKLLLQQQQQTGPPLSGISSIEDEPMRRDSSNNNNNNSNGFSSSDCEESIVSSPIQQQQQSHEASIEVVVCDKPLPEKGKLLQAVMKAGPLLQTLLLAGPLPQWRHPPPPLDSFEIPPVTIPSPPPHHHQQQQQKNSLLVSNNGNRRRVLCEGGSESPTEAKYQRILLH